VWKTRTLIAREYSETCNEDNGCDYANQMKHGRATNREKKNKTKQYRFYVLEVYIV